MDTSAPHRTGQRVRPELPVTRVVALAVRDLDVAGAPERACATLTGAGLEVEAGTITLLTPARAGRTIVLCLAGDLARQAGDLETGDGPARRSVESTSWHLTVSRAPHASHARAGELLADAGRAAPRAAERLGLGPVLDRAVAELDPAQRVLLGVALALADGPDVVALDDPAGRLDLADLARVLDAVRDLVDVDGRTVLVVGDLDDLPPILRGALDDVIELGRFADAP